MLTVITPATNTRLTTVDNFRSEFPSVTTAIASDGQVQRWIDRASSMAVDYCQRVFAAEVVRQIEFPHLYGNLEHGGLHYAARVMETPSSLSRIVIERTPATDLVVTVDGSTLTDGTDYHHDKRRGCLYRLMAGRPSIWCGTVQLDYTGGYVLPGDDGANLPGDVEYAVQLWMARFVAAMTTATSAAEGGLKAEQIVGVGTFEYYSKVQSVMPGAAGVNQPTPESLLAPFRVMVF